MLYTVPNRDLLFETTSKKYLDLLNKFKNTELPMVSGPWDFSPIYDILGCMPDSTKLFESVSSNMNDVTDYTIGAIGFSVIQADKRAAPHIDNHPQDGRFKRYHLPLQIPKNARLNVMENGTDFYKEYSWEVGKWMRFEALQHIHFPTSGKDAECDRIIVIMDVFEGEADPKDILEYYETVENLGWLEGIDFRPYYEKYISNKKNK